MRHNQGIWKWDLALTDILADSLADILAYILVGILADILADILASILADILAGRKKMGGMQQIWLRCCCSSLQVWQVLWVVHHVAHGTQGKTWKHIWYEMKTIFFVWMGLHRLTALTYNYSELFTQFEMEVLFSDIKINYNFYFAFLSWHTISKSILIWVISISFHGLMLKEKHCNK